MQLYVYFISLFVMFGTILIVFGMKYVSAAYQARAKAKVDDAWREVAERAAAAQAASAASLASIDQALSGLAGRLAAVEQILKAVE